MHQTMYCNMGSCGKIYQLQLINVIHHQLHLFNVTNAYLVIGIGVAVTYTLLVHYHNQHVIAIGVTTVHVRTDMSVFMCSFRFL